MWDTFWHFLWSMLVIFAFVAYLMILYTVLVDLFWRDRTTSGIVKAIWVIGLVAVPYLTALLYLIVRGKGMAERAMAQAATDKQQADDYIRDVAGRSPVQEIAEARKLRDDGVLTDAEFDRIKTAALAE